MASKRIRIDLARRINDIADRTLHPTKRYASLVDLNYAVLTGQKTQTKQNKITISVNRRRLYSVQIWMNLAVIRAEHSGKTGKYVQGAIANLLFFISALDKKNIIPFRDIIYPIKESSWLRRRHAKVVDIALSAGLSGSKDGKSQGITNFLSMIADNKEFDIGCKLRTLQKEIPLNLAQGMFWHAGEKAGCTLFGTKACLYQSRQIGMIDKLLDDETIDRDIGVLLHNFAEWNIKFPRSKRYILPKLRCDTRPIEPLNNNVPLPSHVQNLMGVAGD